MKLQVWLAVWPMSATLKERAGRRVGEEDVQTDKKMVMEKPI